MTVNNEHCLQCPSVKTDIIIECCVLWVKNNFAKLL